ncbi:MAG: extracellular solute-binding protein [Oscillospiraceae bacterium]|nr:extracellular solute-binding protein [Oscillospiraceae bacterium]
MKKTKLSAFILALTMASGALTACGAQNESIRSDSENSRQTEQKEDIVLTIAVNGTPDMQDVIDAFNAAENGYRIEMKQYRELTGADGLPITYTDEEAQYADMEILQDIINTDEIDIICSQSFFNNVYYEILKNKGAYADLYQFMAEDTEVNTDTLNRHVLSLNEVDGKLCSLPTFYGITTMIGETQYVGTKENWTVDEFISRWEQMPGNATISNSRQSENVYYVMLRNNLEAFVDHEHAQVHFDSPDFKRLLEFCGSFESNHGQKGTYDYDAPQFVQEFYIDGFMGADGAAQGDFYDDGRRYTMVGFPSADGDGAFLSDRAYSYAISAKSSPDEQKGAWEFIRSFVTYEYQMSHVIPLVDDGHPDGPRYSSEIGLCINNRAFEETAKGIMDGTYYGGTYEDKGKEYEITLPTQEDYERLTAYIQSIQRWETRSHGPLWNIINEEIMYYFSGERTLDETVELIQSRASIWISEQS